MVGGSSPPVGDSFFTLFVVKTVEQVVLASETTSLSIVSPTVPEMGVMAASTGVQLLSSSVDVLLREQGGMMSWVGSPKISFRYSVSDSSPAREMTTECQLFSAVNCGLEGVATGELRCFTISLRYMHWRWLFMSTRERRCTRVIFEKLLSTLYPLVLFYDPDRGVRDSSTVGCGCRGR